MHPYPHRQIFPLRSFDEPDYRGSLDDEANMFRRAPWVGVQTLWRLLDLCLFRSISHCVWRRIGQ